MAGPLLPGLKEAANGFDKPAIERHLDQHGGANDRYNRANGDYPSGIGMMIRTMQIWRRCLAQVSIFAHHRGVALGICHVTRLVQVGLWRIRMVCPTC